MAMIYEGFGACRKVPGSKHCLIIDGVPMFIDFGAHMERDNKGASLDEKIDSFPELNLGFPISSISSIILTHAHADHMGDLPELLAEGRKETDDGKSNGGLSAKIYGTEATKDLLSVQLNQSNISVQEYNNSIKGKRTPDGNYVPFKKEFVKADYDEILGLYVPVQYREPVQIQPNVKATFYDAGHIIGSAQVVLEVEEKTGKQTKILFTGDLGRKDFDTPILNYPDKDLPKDIDYIVVESTYGDRLHDLKETSLRKLEQVINDTYKKGGKIIAGAFTVERTQQILYDIYDLYKQGKLPKDFKVYLDSPTAVKVNEVIKNHGECFDEKAKEEFSNEENCFNFPALEIINKSDDSKALVEKKGPYMVISAHGMFVGGRILRHLAAGIEDERNTILITGYQAPGTLGSLLEQGNQVHHTIKIKEESYGKDKKNLWKEYEFKANVERIRGYSGHSDLNEIVEHLTQVADPSRVKGVFVVHGELQGSQAVAKALREKGYKNVIVPFERKEYPLS